jgi:hypothetical protein
LTESFGNRQSLESGVDVHGNMPNAAIVARAWEYKVSAGSGEGGGSQKNWPHIAMKQSQTGKCGAINKLRRATILSFPLVTELAYV